MKILLSLTILLTSASSFASVSYNCVANNARFTMTKKPGNTIGYYQQVNSMGVPMYAWQGTLRSVTKCSAKNASCYTGQYSAHEIKKGAAVPKTLIKVDLQVATALLNGAMSGKVTKTTLNEGSVVYTCNMPLK